MVLQDVVQSLHNVLRPFLLRRLKADVEKQLPGKHEHVIYCRLSKRQRQLYDEYLASSDTSATLSSGNFLGIINVLMQLRKVWKMVGRCVVRMCACMCVYMCMDFLGIIIKVFVQLRKVCEAVASGSQVCVWEGGVQARCVRVCMCMCAPVRVCIRGCYLLRA